MSESTQTVLPRPEYPRPQFVRPDWLCLNGEWEFEIDSGDSGLERDMNARALAGKIVVPFCPESKLSGLGHVDFMGVVWYRKTLTLPGEWKGRDVLLHFQAVDYDAIIWVNGVEVGRHRGGFTGFTCDLSGVVGPGEVATIVVRARDNHRQPKPMGKQSSRFGNHGCHYTRTTGIWQTVWLEPVAKISLKRPRITPDVAGGAIRIDQPLTRTAKGLKYKVTLSDDRGVVLERTVGADAGLNPQATLEIPEPRRRLWSIEDPFLYGLRLELIDAQGVVVDRAESYAGLRSIRIEGKKVLINGKSVFQRLVLDQGYYPDGIMTAPSDAALIEDISISMEAGFNGARLHQKVFEERFLYHADRMGYLVWGEFGDWGCGGHGPAYDHQKPDASYITQWLEALERDYSHPSIIGWCPLNETQQVLHDGITVLDDVTRGVFLATKAMDLTRPVLDASGYSHRVQESDIYDCHDYEQDAAKMRVTHEGLAQGRPFMNVAWGNGGGGAISIPYRGQPFFVSEFGGILWNPNVKPGEAAWGYGQGPKTIEEFYRRFSDLCAVLLEHEEMFGYCYTQLTDVFQEQNGVVTFDRKRKLDLSRLRAAQQRIAAVER